jgi:hypothetical protein
MAGLEPHLCAVSRSHTLGAGAALVGPAGRRLGVDLVAVARVSERHARTLLGPREWAALEFAGGARPALAWALKEAAAKASGDPARCFPDGLLIEHDDGGLCVRIAETAVVLRGDWMMLEHLLCAYTLPRVSPRTIACPTRCATRSGSGSRDLASAPITSRSASTRDTPACAR